jgi:hypothetical protein
VRNISEKGREIGHIIWKSVVIRKSGATEIEMAQISKAKGRGPPRHNGRGEVEPDSLFGDFGDERNYEPDGERNSLNVIGKIRKSHYNLVNITKMKANRRFERIWTDEVMWNESVTD